MHQHTLKDSFTLRSIGLHTGLMLTATFRPAEAGTGIRLRRTDLEGQPCHEALADYVSATERGTVLSSGEWRISTVEHALSALYALGVDNCLIDIDGPEMPILDGSADPYVREIARVGLLEQEAEQHVWVVNREFSFDTPQGNRMRITPCDHYEARVIVRYPSPVLGEQAAEVTDLSAYSKEIAQARTFCFVREIEPLLMAGLIKGGDLQNALVIYDHAMPQERLDALCDKLSQEHLPADRIGYLTPLHYPNEPARHKLLDLIGDLSLVGMHIQGRIEAECPGHGFNTTCAKALRTQLAK